MPEKESSAGGQSEREKMTPEDRAFLEASLKSKLSPEERAEVDADLHEMIEQVENGNEFVESPEREKSPQEKIEDIINRFVKGGAPIFINRGLREAITSLGIKEEEIKNYVNQELIDKLKEKTQSPHPSFEEIVEPTQPPAPETSPTSSEPVVEIEEELTNRAGELWKQLVDYWIEELILLPESDKKIEKMKAKVGELTEGNEDLKEKLLADALKLVAPTETTEPQPEPTPEEKKQIEGAEKKETEAADEAIRQEAERPVPPLIEAKPLTPDEAKAFEKIGKPEDIEALPEETKEKLGLGFSNLGFYIEEKKNKFLSGTLEKAASRVDQKSTAGRFVSSLVENFRRDEETAKKRFEAAKQGQTQHLSNMGYLFGNILRYGRTLLDFTNYTVASPLRYITMGAMMFSRGAEAAKEARLKNEEVIEKTRAQDINAAEAEAWKIYEAAQTKAGEDKGVSKEDLNRAYLENLPQDLIKRLNTEPNAEIKTGTARKIIEKLTELGIEKDIKKLQEKLLLLEFGAGKFASLSPPERENEKQKLIKKYETKLKDYDRIISQYGEIDALAIAGKRLEQLGRGVVKGMTVETLVTLPLEKLFEVKIWDNIAEALGEKVETAEISPISPKEIEYYDSVIGINSSDGIDERELQNIGVKMGQLGDHPETVAEAEKLKKIYGNMRVKDTDKTVVEYLRELRSVKPPIETPRPFEETTPTESVKPKLEVPTPIEEELGDKTEPLIPIRYEDIIDSSRVGTGSDSVWRSTKEIFLYKTPEQLKELGFDVPRKLPSGESNPEFGPTLDKWVETQTANLVKGWSEAHGGRSPDVVHSGDKVVIEFDTENKPHLKILNAEDKEIEPKSFTPPTEEQPGPTVRVQAEVTPVPTPETSPAELSPADEFKKSWEKVTKEVFGLQGEEEKAKIVKNYVEKAISGQDYTGHKIQGEKLNTFAHMFPMEGMGFAEKTEDIDTSQKLAEAIGKFEKQLTETTKVLLKDGFKNMGGETKSFPIVSADGARIFFANPAGNNRWGIFKYNQSGTDFESIKNPNKLFGTREFRVKDIKKLLGY